MKSPDRFLFLSGLTWLDFVNTRPVLNGERVDLLATPNDVVDWITAFRRVAGGDGPEPPRAGVASLQKDEIHRDAFEIRERLDGLARRAAGRRPVPRDIPAWIDGRLEAMPGALHLIQGRKKESATIEFIPDPEPAALLFPVIHSTAEWLAAGGRPVVKACGNPECVLYFGDTTKSGTRRWCSAASCGNRSRVAAFRKRHSSDG